MFPLEPLSVPPESSTLAPPGARASRDASPLSSSVGSSPSREGNKEEDSDPTLPSDMLMSLTASMAEMSIRQSLHIGVGLSDLVLPSNEEIAKSKDEEEEEGGREGGRGGREGGREEGSLFPGLHRF